MTKTLLARTGTSNLYVCIGACMSLCVCVCVCVCVCLCLCVCVRKRERERVCVHFIFLSLVAFPEMSEVALQIC